MDDRAKFLAAADKLAKWFQADGNHHEIIDVYNTIVPLPRGYKMSYTDDWCAAFVSAAAQMAGLTDILYPECSCGEMINKYNKAGRWVEDDAYHPRLGELVFYAWDDSGDGDNRRAANHVGIVTAVNESGFLSLEGNKGNAVGIRNMQYNGKYIRGFAIPAFKDLGISEWASEAYRWAVDSSLTDGNNPKEAVSLERLVTILYRYDKLRRG